MRFFKGRHQEVMPALSYEQARSAGELPDIWIGSAEYDETCHRPMPPDFLALMEIETDLDLETRQRLDDEADLVFGPIF